jgi:lipoprotein LprG
MSLLAPLLAVCALLLALTACGAGGPSEPPLPAGQDLLAKSASTMAAVQTAAIDVQVDPALSTLPVRSATGKLTASGDAIGTATLNQGSSPVEFNFVITKGTLYLKGPTGRYQRLPLALAASIYDPTALLNPDRGIAALLRTATNGTTQAREDVNGAPAYRVHANLDPALVSAVVPGLAGANSGTVWLDQASSRLLKAQVEVPNPAGGAPAPVTLTLSDLNAPVTVAPPS